MYVQVLVELLIIEQREACALQKLINLMNEESPRKSLVKGERFVRHDDTSEDTDNYVLSFGTGANSNSPLPGIAATLITHG